MAHPGPTPGYAIHVGPPANVNLYMPASIHDVAQRAQVSVATVSRSYTVPETVREATRARVLQAAASLGYRPNRAARGLITGRELSATKELRGLRAVL